MPIAPTIDLLSAAQRDGYAVGAFNVIGVEHAQAIVAAAERERSPVILQVSQNAVRYHLGLLAPIGAACAALAASASVPVAMHLDHATTWELCQQGLDLGFGSVMYDASLLTLEENVAETARIAERVHARQRSIEAELGVVGGKEGATTSDEGNTDPDLAKWYVKETGIDAIAVAVGTSHYMVDKTAVLDLDRISQLREAVSVPLVLHGASGVADDVLEQAVRRGITKVNTATELNMVFTGVIRDYLPGNPDVVDPRKYLQPARDAVIDVVGKRLRLLGSDNRV